MNTKELFTRLKALFPGLFLVLAISFTAKFLNTMLIDNFQIALEALTIAILIGIIFNNLILTKSKDIFKPGISFSSKRLLNLGIILLGFKLNINALLELGPTILLMVLIYIPLTLIFAVIIGKVFGVDIKLATLIGVGSSICGASAVVAMTPCINADEDDSVIAVSVVSFLGAIGVLTYSAIAVSGLNISATQYGVWSGLTLHGVAHALAAAFALGNEAGEIGTVVKMTRVLMLVPVSLILSYLFNRKNNTRKTAGFPMYVLYFIIAGIINTTGFIPEYLTKIFIKTSDLFILMAMTSMGLSVNLKSILNKGIKAVITGTLLFIILSTFALLSIFQIIG